MNLYWLLRMRRWVDRPPSRRRVMLVVAIIAVCLVLYGFEQIFGWPDWLTVNGGGRRALRP